MKVVSKIASATALLAIIASATLPARATGARRTDAGPAMVVIVSAMSRVRGMSSHTIRDIFTGVRTDNERGEAYVPLAHPAHTPLRVAFDRQFLGLEPDAVGRFWVDQRIRARLSPPRTVATVALALRVVAALRTAISYASSNDLVPGVVPLIIDRQSYESPSYPFRAPAPPPRD